jgi:putative redox protein
MSADNVRQVRLVWTGEGLSFRGGPDAGVQIGVDSDGAEGQTPMQLLLMALGSCMGVDVLMILQKSRVPLESLEVEVVGVRADAVPKRYRSVTLTYRISGPSEDDQAKLDRAIELSRDKYCSVLHTLDPELDVDISVERG